MKNGMFFRMEEEQIFEKNRYLDISSKLHCFLQTETIGIRLLFASEMFGSGALLAVYYKDSFLPDFAVGLVGGLIQVTTKKNGQTVIGYSENSYCDGVYHELLLNGDEHGLRLWVDGRQELAMPDCSPYCAYGYVGFATLGRACSQYEFGSFYEGRIKETEISDEPFPEPGGTSCGGRKACEKPSKTSISLFCQGMGGYENFRIPSMLVTDKGTVVATADGRKEAPGDNPNHIARVVRRSTDSGKTWSPATTVCDFGGTGREDGAAAIDGSLTYDRETGRIFMVYSHTPAGVGSWLSEAGTGLDEEGRLLLKDQEQNVHSVAIPGFVPGMEPLYLDDYRQLSVGSESRGSVCHGENRILSEANTSFLQMIYSDDEGETWSHPQDLNGEVKAHWMHFIGPCPGTGIQIRTGPYAGRLVIPIYYSNESHVYSSGVIYSDDHGGHWSRGASVNDGRIWEGNALSAKTGTDLRTCLGESQVTELPDGRLKIFIRTSLYDSIATAVSEDGGETWIQPGEGLSTAKELADCDCQCYILRLESEEEPVYLFSNPSHPSKRARGRIRISRDGTAHWSKGFLVESGEFGYSCMARLPDGTLGILYEGRNVELRFLRLSMERQEEW